MQKHLNLPWKGELQDNSKLPESISQLDKNSLIKKILEIGNQISGQSIVISLSCDIISNNKLLSNFIDNIKLLSKCGAGICIVHDYEEIVEEKLKEFGIKESIKNLNIFDYKTMQITEMIISGYIRNSIISKFYNKECNIVGLSGMDCNLIQTQSYEVLCNNLGINTIEVKAISASATVDPELLFHLEDIGAISVISPVTSNKLGGTKLLHADSTAAIIAQALGAEHLILFSNNSEINGKSLTGKNLQDLKNIMTSTRMSKDDSEQSKFLPMVKASVYALENDIEFVHINNCKLEDNVLTSLITSLTHPEN